MFIIDILFILEYCFDSLEWKISACWSILAKNHIIILKKMYVYDRYTFYVRILLNIDSYKYRYR